MLQRRNLLEDKRGDLTGTIYFVASIAAFAIFLLIVGYIGNTVGTAVKGQINSTDDNVNKAFDKTITMSTSGLSSLWYIMFGGLLIGLMISAWFIPTHPIFVAPFLILLIVAIIVGAAMANAYDVLRLQADLAATGVEQGTVGFLMGGLPYIALAVGIITLIITFSKPGESNQQIM